MKEIWRIYARELLPELSDSLEDDEITPYLFLTEVKDLAVGALKAEDVELANRAFHYADWCRTQNEKDIWNSSVVCFYEYIFDEDDLEQTVAKIISKDLFAKIEDLLEETYADEKPEKFMRLKELYTGRGK